MSQSPTLSCARCRVPIGRGESHYVMSLRLTAGFDGYLPEPEPGESTNGVLETCLNLDAETLEAQVNQQFEFTVCPACRNHIALDPLQLSTVSEQPKTLQ